MPALSKSLAQLLRPGVVPDGPKTRMLIPFQQIHHPKSHCQRKIHGGGACCHLLSSDRGDTIFDQMLSFG